MKMSLLVQTDLVVQIRKKGDLFVLMQMVDLFSGVDLQQVLGEGINSNP